MSTPLTAHFSLEELTASQTAQRKGFDNTPDAAAVEALRRLCFNVLEPMRQLLGVPIFVNSGYRSAQVNRAVGGAAKSQHVKGEAADLSFKGLTVQEAFARVKASEIIFDQMIEEGTWLHVSFTNTRPNRRQCLRARFENGKASYSEA